MENLKEIIKETDWFLIGIGAVAVASCWGLSKLAESAAEVFRNSNSFEYVGMKANSYLAKGITVIGGTQYLANIIKGKYNRNRGK